MPVSGVLRRLLRVRDLEEEQHRHALESALADLHALEHALSHTRDRQRRGRERIASGTRTADPADRIAAQVEMESAARHSAALVSRIAVAESEAARLRGQYLEKRVERRQAETLISATEAEDAVIADRRAQQELDHWFSVRARRAKSLAMENNRSRAKKH